MSRPALGDGPLHHCRACRGAWIDEASLGERVATMRQSIPRPLVWSVDSKRIELPCAACSASMQALRLYSVEVDRCRDHGVWFDANELPLVLARSTAAEYETDLAAPAASIATAAAITRSPADPSSAAGTALDIVADVAIDGTQALADGLAPGILESVFDGAFDVLGAIFSAIDL